MHLSGECTCGGHNCAVNEICSHCVIQLSHTTLKMIHSSFNLRANGVTNYPGELIKILPDFHII